MSKLTDILRQIIDQVDDGPNFCVGREATGNLVWKGSFLRLIEEVRALLPQDDRT